MGLTDISDHQEQGTPARYAFHHRVRLSDTCGKHAWTEAAADGGPSESGGGGHPCGT